MEARRPIPPTRPGALVSVVPAIVLLLLVVGGLSVLPTRPLPATAKAGAWTGPYSWTNQVLTERSGAFPPIFSVSSSNATQPFGLQQNPPSLSEQRISGVVLSTFPFRPVNWTRTNVSSVDGAFVSFSRFLNAAGGEYPLVFVNLTTLANGVAGTEAGTVVENLSIVGFQPEYATDFVRLSFPLAPLDPFLEMVTGGPTDTLESVDRATSAPEEFFAWSPQATVRADGSSSVVDVSATVATNSTGANVSVLVPGAAHAYQVIQYSVRLGVVTPAPRVVVTRSELALVAVVGAAAGVVLVLLARWVWKGPPQLLRPRR